MKPGILGLIAACLLVAGLVIGFSPVHSDGYNCGSAFHERENLSADVIYNAITYGTGENGCDDARANRQVFAWVPLGLGAVLGVAAFALMPTTSQRERQTAP